MVALLQIRPPVLVLNLLLGTAAVYIHKEQLGNSSTKVAACVTIDRGAKQT